MDTGFGAAGKETFDSPCIVAVYKGLCGLLLPLMYGHREELLRKREDEIFRLGDLICLIVSGTYSIAAETQGGFSSFLHA